MVTELRLVDSAEDVRSSIARFNEALRNWEYAKPLARTTWYWVFDSASGAFGPSKFVGFAGLGAAGYDAARDGEFDGARFDGNATRTAVERALAATFESHSELPARLKAWAQDIWGTDVFDGINDEKWKFLILGAGAPATDAHESAAGVQSPPPTASKAGVPYRRATEDASRTPVDPFFVDPEKVDRGNQAHALTQNALADWLTRKGIEPRSPGPTDPDADLIWQHGGTLYVAEVKSLTIENEEKQLRAGLGQLLRYRQSLKTYGLPVVGVLVSERKPSDVQWRELCGELSVRLVWPDAFERVKLRQQQAAAKPNLLRPEWSKLDSSELEFILLEMIGSPGQYDGRENSPNVFYLPQAGVGARVRLTYSEVKRIVAIDPGPAFDPAQWAEVVKEIEGSGIQVGREYCFSGFPVRGGWRGKKSGLQILPPPSDAPLPPVEMAEHPFILEFPIRVSAQWSITNFRRMREHRTLALLLNVLLAGRVTIQPRQARHFWAIEPTGNSEPRWVQEFYFAKLGEAVQPALSPSATEALEQIDATAYYAHVGYDGRGLRVPDDLDDSICCFLNLSEENKDRFARAAFWMSLAAKQWTTSVSASFASLVIAIEAVGERDSRPTIRFQNFIERHAPGKSLEQRRLRMYDVRSAILHGSDLLEMDRDLRLGWAPPQLQERDLMDDLWGLARIALRSWLKNPS